MAGLARLLTHAQLLGDFTEETLARARSYAQGDAVGVVQELGSTGHTLRSLAWVTGSGHRRYTVILTASAYADGLEVETRCSCPVQRQCKHGAALAMVLAARAGVVGSDWESVLTRLLDDLAPGEPHAPPKAVALRMDLRVGRHSYRSDGPVVTLRLLNQGARGNWVKTGIGWRTIPAALERGTHRADHLHAVGELHAGLVASNPYLAAMDDVALDDFGPLVWSGLARAREGGIHLELGRGLSGFELLDEPLGIGADVVADGGDSRLSVGVSHAGRLWSGADVVLVGSPAHGVVLLDADGGDDEDRRAILAPLARPLPRSVVHLLRTDEAVRLPADHRGRWSDELLPRLGRVIEVGSSDDSVPIVPPPQPCLRLSVDWATARRATLRWDWVYGEREVPLDGPDTDGLRDRAGEREILGRVPWPRRIVATEDVTGPDAAELALVLLPALDGIDDVAVVQRGAPDFREAVGELEISFDAAAGDEQSDGPTDWLDLWVMIRIEGEQVPLPEVLQALTLGHDHVVLPSGLMVCTDRPELAALDDLVRAAAELRDSRGDTISVGHVDLGLWSQLAKLGVVDQQAAEWVRRAQALADLTELPEPDLSGLVSELRPYQRDGVGWLVFLWQSGLGGILADDMGLGKTLQVLGLIGHARARGAAPFLVVAPTSVVGAWQSEVARHTPGLQVRAITASAKRRGQSIADLAVGADVVVTTYTLLRLEAEQYDAVEWGGVVLDEAQQVKNHQGKTHQAIRRLEAPFKLAVTGTPFENRLMELWSLLSITTPGLYPWPTDFQRSVARPVEKDGDADVLRRFRQRIRPFVLRRTKELVAADLPPKQEQVLTVQLGARHRRLYDTHLQKERQRLLGLLDDFEGNRVAIFSALTRLRQLALDPGLVDADESRTGSAKLDALVEHLSAVVAEGHRALVFSQFTSYLTKVEARLAAEGFTTSYLDGRTRDRPAVVAEFRSGGSEVFLISLKAGGVGLTLTEADYVFVLDPWWNPATEAQAVDRAHRIGQLRPVMVYRLVSHDTIEDKVMALKARKADLFRQVVDGDGMLATTIDADDVRALLAG